MGQPSSKPIVRGREGCLLVDALMPGMSGIELIERLKAEGHRLPAIVITGNGAVPMAVQAMKAGAVDFIEKPVGHEELLASVERALDQTRDTATLSASRETAATRVASLTTRQRQILDLVLAGHPSKNIAADLGISQRTVDNHRAAIMKKTGSKSLPASDPHRARCSVANLTADMLIGATSCASIWMKRPAVEASICRVLTDGRLPRDTKLMMMCTMQRRPSPALNGCESSSAPACKLVVTKMTNRTSGATRTDSLPINFSYGKKEQENR